MQLEHKGGGWEVVGQGSSLLVLNLYSQVPGEPLLIAETLASSPQLVAESSASLARAAEFDRMLALWLNLALTLTLIDLLEENTKFQISQQEASGHDWLIHDRLMTF